MAAQKYSTASSRPSAIPQIPRQSQHEAGRSSEFDVAAAHALRPDQGGNQQGQSRQHSKKIWAGLKEISPAAAVKRQRKSGIVRSRQSTAEAAVSAVRNKSARTGYQPL